jgi:hypothetical protein
LIAGPTHDPDLEENVMNDLRVAKNLCRGLGLVVLVAACHYPGERAPRIPTSFDQDEAPFTTAQEKGLLSVFRLPSGQEVKEVERARQVSSRLFAQSKIRPGEMKPDASHHLIQVGADDPSASFRLDRRTGSFSFNGGFRSYLGGQSTSGLPQPEQAVELARRHLDDLGLLPASQDQLFVQHVGGIRAAERNEQGALQAGDKLVTVHFGRKIGGVEVGGPGSKIVVTMGSGGELVALYRRWLEGSEERKRPGELLSRKEVLAAVRAAVIRDAVEAERVKIATPEAGYYDDGEGNIEPAYFVVAELVFDDAKDRHRGTERYLEVIPALKAPRAVFVQETRAEKSPAAAPQGRTRSYGHASK